MSSPTLLHSAGRRLRRFPARLVLAAVSLLTGAMGAQAADVGVSIQISQPGVYGRVDIGRYPQPQVVLPQPVIIQQHRAMAPEPVYLWVPPGHRKNWRKHCQAYGACGAPMYFVRDDWYEREVHGRRHGRDGDDRHDPGRGHDRGHGHGHGH